MHRPAQRRLRAFSLVEMMIVVAIIGIMAMMASPVLKSVNESAKDSTAQRNAQNLAQLSATLHQIGIAHVLPESLGGVEAKARLLREGVIVDTGTWRDQEFSLILSDDEITRAAEYLDVVYDTHENRLIYAGPMRT